MATPLRNRRMRALAVLTTLAIAQTACAVYVPGPPYRHHPPDYYYYYHEPYGYPGDDHHH